MRDDTIAAFLDQLAARVPAPGGGATAALHAAQAAALLAMVARYSDGAKYDARLNIEVNVKGITDPVLAEEFGAAAAIADTVAERADAIIAAVRAEIAR